MVKNMPNSKVRFVIEAGSNFDRINFYDWYYFGLGKANAGKEKKEKKPPQPKKETAKKDKEAPPPEEELDPTEAALAAEPKSKDPFDSLPKGYIIVGSFNIYVLSSWKVLS